MKKELRSGYTTGACAAAAAKGAALMLVSQASAAEVTIELPGGIGATFQLQGQTFSTEEARCFVVKDAGDDPDVTNGVEVWAVVTAVTGSRGKETCGFEGQAPRVIIEGGVGIGRATKPGLAVPPGEWAINPVPRRMIEQAVLDVFSSALPLDPCPLGPGESLTLSSCPLTLNISISIPDGEQRAQKTLNARLGIIGGLSILGTTGIVRPISAKAWTDTIDAALDVAKACGCRTVVLSTGRSSEMAAQRLFMVRGSRFMVNNEERFEVQGSAFKVDNREPRTTNHELRTASNHEQLPEEAYIMMGDHVAYALQACRKRGFNTPIVACQFAKLLKIACGHDNTHAAASELDLKTLLQWAENAAVSPEHLTLIASANTAREVATESGFDRNIMELVSEHAIRAAAGHAPGIKIHPLLCSYDGSVALH